MQDRASVVATRGGDVASMRHKPLQVSKLIWGFKQTDIETAREKLEHAFNFNFKVSRDDDAGVRYISYKEDPTPPMSLYPNYDVDEEGEFFVIEEFKDFPVLLSVLSYETYPNFIDIVSNIPGLDAVLLERRERADATDQ